MLLSRFLIAKLNICLSNEQQYHLQINRLKQCIFNMYVMILLLVKNLSVHNPELFSKCKDILNRLNTTPISCLYFPSFITPLPRFHQLESSVTKPTNLLTATYLTQHTSYKCNPQNNCLLIPYFSKQYFF